MDLLKIAQATALTAFLCGCVSSRPMVGAERIPPEQRVTIIKAPRTNVGIYKIDDEHRGYGFVERFEITPGVHEVTFTGGTTNTLGIIVGQGAFKFKFEPGRTYIIETPAPGSFSVSLIDQKTGVALTPL